MFAVKRGWLAPFLAGALAACSGNPFKSSPLGNASGVDLQFVSASQTWDLDKNGTITCDEWKQYSSAELKSADGDGDGALNAQEWAKLSSSDRLFDSAGLSHFDMNGDGKVTTEEIAGKPNPAFKMLDRNNDCQIAHDEKATVYSNVKPKDKGGDQPPGPPGPGGR